MRFFHRKWDKLLHFSHEQGRVPWFTHFTTVFINSASPPGYGHDRVNVLFRKWPTVGSQAQLPASSSPVDLHLPQEVGWVIQRSLLGSDWGDYISRAPTPHYRQLSAADTPWSYGLFKCSNNQSFFRLRPRWTFPTLSQFLSMYPHLHWTSFFCPLSSYCAYSCAFFSKKKKFYSSYWN